MSEMTRFGINICLLGTLSVGKTTFVKTLLSEIKTVIHVDKSTIYPQIYHEMHPFNKSTKMIFNPNYHLTVFEQCIPKISQLTNRLEGVFLSIHDIPGLNSVNTKDIHTRFVKKNFSKYDIIVFMIDVTTSLNTSDEINLLNLIIEQLWENQKRGLVQKLIIVVNKCENYDVDDEIQEMFRQVETIIKHKIKDKNLKPIFFPLACENAYVYYMTIHQPEIMLDMEIYDRIGISQFGKKEWTKIKCEKIKFIQDAIIHKNIDLDSGFENIINHISNYLGDSGYWNQYLILQNRIKSSWSNLLEYVNQLCVTNKWILLYTKMKMLSKKIWRILHYSMLLYTNYCILDSIKSTPMLFIKYLEQYFNLYISYLDDIPARCLIIIGEHLRRIVFFVQKIIGFNDKLLVTRINMIKLKILVYQTMKYNLMPINNAFMFLDNYKSTKYSHELILRNQIGNNFLIWILDWIFRLIK